MAAKKRHLICKEIPDWPKLAWVAVLKHDSDRISVLHGPRVETGPDRCMEAVWAGDYAEGNFDLTDVVVGTGVRVRGDEVVFVPSGDTMSRLQSFVNDETTFVSNSLPALLAVADLALLPEFDYVTVLQSLINGIETYIREIPSTGGPIRLTYFNNLVFTGSELVEREKPTSAPAFTEFADYRDYLFDCARRVGENARAGERHHPISLLATMSSGYDSTAAAVLAREAGARRAVTIKEARRSPAHILNVDDSGAGIARQLDMTCKEYSRSRNRYAFEDAAWAYLGNPGDINLTAFDYPNELCLLFTGFYGDVLWDKNARHSELLRRKDSSGSRFGECRIELGVFNCSPVFWGCRQDYQVHALNKRPEMAPWTLGTHYDRPIPRRLAEEAGIARASFGTRKRVSSFARRFGRPLSADLREDFAEFMKRRGLRATTGFMEGMSLVLRGIEALFLTKLPRAIRFSCKDWVSLPENSDFFLWANERRKDRYLASFDRSDWFEQGTADT